MILLPWMLLLLVWDESLPKFTLPVILTLLISFTVRLVSKWIKKTLTWQESVARLFYAFALVWFLLYFWMDFEVQHSPVYAVGIIGLVSMEIVNELDKALKIGVKTWIRSRLNTLMAKDE